MRRQCRIGAAVFLLTVCPMSLRASVDEWPLMDGVMAPGEWATGRTLAIVGGVKILAMRDEAELYLGVESDRAGILTVHIATGDMVRALHASDALAEALFTRTDGDVFTLTNDWGAWDRSQDLDGQRAFMDLHGWVATIGPMGPPGEREFVLDLSRLPEGARVAISYAAAPDFETTLTIPDGLDDSTTLTAVQRGFLPKSATFAVESWIAVSQFPASGDSE